ncbi:hypothetical protein QJS04_geneDACA014422 [Acorus gramineus]|uniref:Uncharacterized protein n=1 Tax=Acorus gramineus TaxID=55184 RepID=A0AAV9BNS6_ACOGR|nr:hypothetical protein QJS04_geneDACA014422 [Acorus gramineus]
MVDSIDQQSALIEENSILLARLETVEERIERLEALQECVGELEHQVEALQEMLTKIEALSECAAVLELEHRNHSFMEVFFLVFLLFAVFVDAKLSGS